MSKRGNRLVGKRIADRYCITGEIGKGGMGVVFKAIPFDDPSHSVAIKVIQRSGRLGYDDLMRFQKEASLMSQLHHPNIVVFHELGLFGGEDDDAHADELGSGYYIVMEIADGTNLKESLERDGRKDLAYFFEVGLQVSAALDYTHGKNIIHRDIKPHNIIVGPRHGQQGVTVKVLDFGVARLAEAMQYSDQANGAFEREGSGPKAVDEAAGTPLYMAPEQTPLMDAPVDHRVDLYSLGCVLYELLAGKPPFTANSREKLEKQHVFADPEPLTNLRPDVPPLVEKIVHKLLAKHPDDRYQTAFSLHADLMRAKTMFEKAGKPTSSSFPLGLKDRFHAVSLQLKLVGREHELNTLVEGYDAVATTRGRSRLALIKGAAGIGKTRLMNEFRAYLQSRKVKYVTGSFSQHENALPFNALANAFNEYLHRILKSHPHEAEELRRRIRQTCGDMAWHIAEIVPGLKPFLYEKDENDQDLDEEEQLDVMNNPEHFSTFAKAFSDFTRCLGTDNQPVVFLFDDLHWADDKSLDLIDQFFSNANTLQFYLVITQRTGLHLETERFNQFIEKFKKLKRRFVEIELGPVDEGSTREIVGTMLASPESVDQKLVSFLMDQTKGNPMHLVELTRTLVARDMIYPKTQKGDWEYDINALRKTQIQLNTIDLILSRIQEYQEFDRQVLGIAATVGLTFQFEVLLLGGRTQSVPVMKAIQRAMDEGLVVRVTDDPDLKHLGKTFMFAHKKARDAIYEGIEPERRRALHKAIGEKLETAIPNPSEKILFALAHHFNAALVDGQTSDKELAARSLKYNVRAGQAAMRSGSWQTAERYYENASRILDQWQDEIADVQERARVTEILADLAAVQKSHGKALRTYRELLSQPLPIEMHAGIAYKAIYFQLVGGILSETSRLIERTLMLMGRKPPRVSPASWIRACWSVLIDAWPANKRRKRLHRILSFAHKLRKYDAELIDRKTPAIRLYSMGTTLHLRDNWMLSLLYHHHGMVQALRGRGSPASLIRVVGERAALLGYLGFHKTSYAFLDLAMDVAKACSLRAVYGYVALLRALTIDYIKARHDEVGDNLKEALTYLKVNDDRLAFGLGLTFKIFRELSRCNFANLYRYALQMPDTIPTRNWLSPRAVAMMMFGYLLQGQRDHMVRHGEMFLKRREKVAGRSNDLFIRIIRTLISFARGEIDKTRESYIVTMEEFIQARRREFLFPFEEDFIGLFAFTFPVLFEQEYGRHLMRVSEMESLLSRLKKRVQGFKGPGRAIPSLLAARASELMGQNKRIKALYDHTLKTSKISGDSLVQIFAYLWFGIHLLDHGNQKKDYIRRAFILAARLEMRTLVDYIRKVMEKRGIHFKEADMALTTSATASTIRADVRSGSVPSRLFVEHLGHVCDAAEADTSLEEDLEESFAILAKFYGVERIICVLTAHSDGKPRILAPQLSEREAKQILDYISPYFNIRSTLYLPMTDAPWKREGGDEPLEGITLGPIDAAKEKTVVDTNFDGDSTVVMGRPHPADDVTATKVELAGALTTQKRLDARTEADKDPVPAGKALQMSALVPMRSDFDSLGVIFLENVRNLQGRDTAYSRQELDQFGAQLAIFLERKTRFDLRKSASLTGRESGKAIYQPASYTLEEVSWLTLWNRGRLRAQRETTWYLGLSFGPDHYVLAYCSLTGAEQIRERLSSMIWHHLHVIRALAVSSQGRVELSDLREEFTGLFAATPKASTLESIALAFTVFNRAEAVAYSGHFGPSRPFVVGVENVVTPYNDPVLNFTSGRDLRYWEVAADISGPHAYVSSYDTSKLDAAPADTAQKRVAVSLGQAGSEDEMHHILCSLVSEENLPRYYVAAIARLEDAAEEDGASGAA